MNKGQKKILVKKYLDAYNFFDIKALTSVMHPEIKYTSILNSKQTEETHGIDEYIKFAENFKKQFSLNKQTIKKLKWDHKGFTVELDYEISAQSNKTTGLKPGNILKLNGTIDFQFKDDKIISVIDSRNFSN